MKVVVATESSCHHVQTDEADNENIYVRFALGSWMLQMGESLEEIYGNHKIELEKAYQLSKIISAMKPK
jgi:hypothetical protein